MITPFIRKKVLCIRTLSRLTPHTESSYGSLAINIRNTNENEERQASGSPRRHDCHQTNQVRRYRATPKNDMVLYASIIVGAALSYVGYKTYVGEPLTPKSHTEATAAYERLEKDRLERNNRRRNPGIQATVKKKH